MKTENHVANEQDFTIEYEIFPLRAIYHYRATATSEQEALLEFWENHPSGIVRKINNDMKSPKLRNPA